MVGAKVPAINLIPGPNFLTDNVVDNYRLSDLVVGINTVNTDLGIPSNILSLPGALECTM